MWFCISAKKINWVVNLSVLSPIREAVPGALSEIDIQFTQICSEQRDLKQLTPFDFPFTIPNIME